MSDNVVPHPNTQNAIIALISLRNRVCDLAQMLDEFSKVASDGAEKAMALSISGLLNEMIAATARQLSAPRYSEPDHGNRNHTLH